MERSILMLEHDEDDRHITQTIFNENRYPVKLEFVDNSADLFAYLLSCERTATPLPAVILLNHFASPVGAIEIIRNLKESPAYAHIPLVVLSGTIREDLLKKCYQAGASSFILKPSSSQETSKKISAFVSYWFEAVELPH